jgi:hypothetical protein
MKNKLIAGALLFSGVVFLGSCTNNEVPTETVVETITEKVAEPQPEINYLETGKGLAMKTKASLGQNLALAINESGSDGAVEFCNIQAIPIIDSMSVVLNAKIKRVSDKPRNSNSQASEVELAYINSWKVAKANGEKHPPLLSELDGKMVGYYPIVTNQMCLQCHGAPEKEINTKTLSKIKKLYPTDKATGYTEGEIRGIFVVEMNKN